MLLVIPRLVEFSDSYHPLRGSLPANEVDKLLTVRLSLGKLLVKNSN